MLIKTVNYTDFNDNEVTETLHFNLTRSELADIQMSTEGGMDKKLEELVASKNGVEILKMFKGLMAKAYGTVSEDGKRFVKSEEKTKEFLDSLAFDAIYMEILSDENAAIEFVKGILPAQLREQIENQVK